jgi:two-component system, NtrC family, nitrogen regulation sensor histidine kinase GlnL
MIRAEVDRIARLTDRVDVLGMLGPPHFEPLNVHGVLGRVRAVLEPAFPDVLIEERYDPSLPGILGDEDQLIQMLLNLAKNAAEAAGPGGGVWLMSAFRTGLKMRAGPASTPRPVLELRIEDNGPGIPRDVIGNLFRPFVSTKPTGVGVGLALAAEIATRHGGRIELDTASSRTAFCVLLPIDAPPERSA